MLTDYKLPGLGENIKSGIATKVMITVGQVIKKDQSILELETDKAVLEVPSTLSGTVKEVLVKAGSEVKVGQLIMKIDTSDVPGVEAKAKEEKPVTTIQAASSKESEKKSSPTPPSSPKEETIKAEPEFESASTTQDVAAAPSVRRFAREIGIDISQVPGSGPGGRISIEDIKNFSRQSRAKEHAADGGGHMVHYPPLFTDFTKWGAIERKPMSMVRRKTAEHLSVAWRSIPHVTQFDKADITELEQLRKRFAKKAEASGGKLTITAFILKVIASGLKVFPQFNASLDLFENEIIYKKYYHIGVAVDTDRGLLVPVIRDVDKKNIMQLAVELNEIAERARTKKITIEEMQGGSFTITNLGGIGGRAFTPIVNSPEGAILGLSRSTMEPVYVNNEFIPKLMLPLSLSYDHRLIDGADGARFLRWVCEAIQQPFLMDLGG